MYKTILMAGVLAGLGSSALAHATLEQSQAIAGKTTKITLRVPHGCDGQATHTVRVALPDGFYAAKPMPKAGWSLKTETGAYAQPYNNHGTVMTEGLRSVQWRDGHLEDGWYDEFILRGVVGPEVEAGSVLYFKAVQDCADGSVDWTDTSGSHDVPNPAPGLVVVAGESHQSHSGHSSGHGSGHDSDHGDAGHKDGHDHNHEAARTVTVGALEIKGGFARATLPNQPVGGGFFTVTNTGEADDRLLSVATDVSPRGEIHEMSMDDSVMKMRKLEDGLVIAAGETVVLKPGGYHLMFMELTQPLVKGEVLPVTLTFETAGAVVVPLAIKAPNARGSDNHSSHDGH